MSENNSKTILQGLQLYHMMKHKGSWSDEMVVETTHLIDKTQSSVDKTVHSDYDMRVNSKTIIPDTVIRTNIEKHTNSNNENTNQLLTSSNKNNLDETNAKIEGKMDLEKLKKIQTREELQDFLENVDHPLKDLANKTVFSSAIPTTQIQVMAIGEAPGEQEDKAGEPFVGQSGQLLMEIFKSISLSRQENLYISNIVPWRPPGNRTPTTQEMQFFLPYIQKHIEVVKPKILILVGSIPYKTLFPKGDTITKIHGQMLEYKISDTESIPAFVVFHPSYLLRAPSNKALMWKDMLVLKKYLKENNLI